MPLPGLCSHTFVDNLIRTRSSPDAIHSEREGVDKLKLLVCLVRTGMGVSN
jgi:hypothetical protein